MKLIFCPTCWDVIKLRNEKVSCECGKSTGFYLEDGLHAEIGGEAIPIGFLNKSFVDAIQDRPQNGSGREFTAFIIPRECHTVKEMEIIDCPVCGGTGERFSEGMARDHTVTEGHRCDCCNGDGEVERVREYFKCEKCGCIVSNPNDKWECERCLHVNNETS